MDTAITIIIFIVALLIAVGFLVLVLTLVPAINHLRMLFIELEKTSVEVRELTYELRKISANVGGKIEHMDGMISTVRKIVKTTGEITQFINANILKKAGILALFPAIKWGMNYISKRKNRG
jgi:hypothetical protein